jgi:photosystem II stability/assembly factor-like uncharacterized protein
MPPALYVAVLEVEGYVVGRANAPNGVHRYDGESGWTHLGWSTTRCNGLSFDPSRPDVWFLGCGNGVFRTRDGGRSWRVTTGWEITDVQDVAVDPHVPGRVYAGSAYGVWRTGDDGETWHASATGIPAPQATYIGVIEADRTRPGHVLAGGEAGLFRSTDGADRWEPVGPAGVPVRDLRQSAADPDAWLAATDGHGLLASRDGGASWAFVGGPALRGIPFFSVALDPADPHRLAAAGYRTGVLASADGGQGWAPFGRALPEPSVHGLAFDPDGSGRLWAGTVGAGVFVADGPDGTWRYTGIDGGTIVDMVFFGGAA